MKIVVNDEFHEIEPNVTVSGLLEMLCIRAEAIAVEQNLQLIPSSEFSTKLVADGDRFEIVTLVGGG